MRTKSLVWAVVLGALLAGCDAKPDRHAELGRYEVRAATLETQKSSWETYKRLRNPSVAAPAAWTDEKQAELDELHRRIAAMQADGLK